MTNIRQSTHREEVVTDEVRTTGAVVQPTVEAPARRRMLLKSIGTGSAVVASLASRPAYAWHCQSPSAWGSEVLSKMNTSLKNTPGHASYVDETWTVGNWASNSARSMTGVSKAPWDYLLGIYSGPKSLKKACSNDSTKITITMLCSYTGIQAPAGSVGTDYVRTVLGSSADHVKYLIVAQLNYLLLSPLARNDVERCMANIDDLKSMARGRYAPKGGQPEWSLAQIKEYLINNWIAVP